MRGGASNCKKERDQAPFILPLGIPDGLKVTTCLASSAITPANNPPAQVKTPQPVQNPAASLLRVLYLLRCTNCYLGCKGSPLYQLKILLARTILYQVFYSVKIEKVVQGLYKQLVKRKSS
ncbi:MAG: hypothetical protein BA862_07625 [Desulfobulbaceae bacterium S3730MH12]|nr:MAG: hypothetical protein BA862_07625 [Desulfobulbaceae bacterium S3730MH12]OEU80267.1 MAG: hypothetical protein BA873_11405 [Desulfobulbaceae bacterium C00003063]